MVHDTFWVSVFADTCVAQASRAKAGHSPRMKARKQAFIADTLLLNIAEQRRRK
jgi:hypothetical protein